MITITPEAYRQALSAPFLSDGMKEMIHRRFLTLTYGKKEEQIFLGREIAQHRDFSEDTARKIDAAVQGVARISIGSLGISSARMIRANPLRLR